MRFKPSENKLGNLAKFSEKKLRFLEIQQSHFLYHTKKTTRQTYREKTFKPFLLAVLGGVLVIPLLWWALWRKTLPEFKDQANLNQQIKQLPHDIKPNFWQRLRNTSPRLTTADWRSVNRFFQTLISAIHQYNARLDLLELALERQKQQLDSNFTVSELEKIDQTLRKVFAELQSALSLLDVVLDNPEVDLAQFLSGESTPSIDSARYLIKTNEAGNAGQFIQDLLKIESWLKNDLATMSSSELKLNHPP